MRVEKEKRRVNIICHDGYVIRGNVHINPGERTLDFINDARETFIAVTHVEFYYIKEPHAFNLLSKLLAKKDFIILNKSTIKLIEEI
jgi:hypothetical protein